MNEASLTGEEAAVLRIGCAYYDQEGEVLNRILELGMTELKFFQALNRLLDTERALAADPVNVNRMRRLRATRTGEMRS